MDTFPQPWLDVLEANVFHYSLFNEEERTHFRRDIGVFLAGKVWEGCAGLSVTEEMKVTIAAEACLMLLGRENDGFRDVGTLLIYPTGFEVVDEPVQDAGWLAPEAAGLAIDGGPVILAWDAVQAEARDPFLGDNLVIHEFAHQLDFIDGFTDGPVDAPGTPAAAWREVLGKEYKRLCRKVRLGRGSFLGEYAASSEAEFFATASERFFTRPAKLRRHYPALYDLLRNAYAVDPLRWFAEKRELPSSDEDPGTS